MVRLASIEVIRKSTSDPPDRTLARMMGYKQRNLGLLRNGAEPKCGETVYTQLAVASSSAGPNGSSDGVSPRQCARSRLLVGAQRDRVDNTTASNQPHVHKTVSGLSVQRHGIKPMAIFLVIIPLPPIVDAMPILLG